MSLSSGWKNTFLIKPLLTPNSMKRVTFLVIAIFLTLHAQEIFAQSAVSYRYDAAGNRVSRVITIERRLMSPENNEKEPKVYSDMLEDLEILIYPNPTDGIIKVEILKLPENQQARFCLYNLSGKLLIDTKSDSGYETFDLTEQLAGTYILQIIVGENKTEWKIIKI